MSPRGPLTRSSFPGNTATVLPAILFFLSALLPLAATAQQQGPILFHGVILDADTRQPLTGAHYSISGARAGAADSRGMISFYAHYRDTVTFTCVGYKEYRMTVQDTLRAREYVAGIYLSSDTLMIAEVVVVPRFGNIRTEIMSERPAAGQELINATNNLRLSAYQGLVNAGRLGDPATNYELLRQRQRYEAYEKGQIPASQMVAVSPLTLIPLIYLLAAGLPEDPEPPVPYISAREMEHLRAVHDSLIWEKK
ncbi:MAG: hypothetical protein WAV93_09155 [Bacteroidales bacterium]